MTKEEILKIIYPCTAASHFKVEKTSYLHKQAEEAAEKLFLTIKNQPKENEPIKES